MLKHISKVIYEKKMGISLIEYFELEIGEDKNKLSYSDNINNHRSENVDDELAIQYLDRLFRIIDGWKEEYINNDFMDGVEWKLEIRYKDGEIKQYIGKNDFPNNFEYLDKIKHEIINNMK